MKTFLEYTFDVDQIVKMLSDMRASERSSRVDRNEAPVTAGNHLNLILGNIPPAYLDKLPDNARADLAFILLSVLSHHIEQWDELRQYIKFLWDQTVQVPGKSLGRELLNRVSAATMDHINAPFFISYSGPISRSALYTYTQKYPKLVVSQKNYGFGEYPKVEKAVQMDYAERFNNSRELERQIK